MPEKFAAGHGRRLGFHKPADCCRKALLDTIHPRLIAWSMKIRNVVHKGLRRFIEDDDTTGLQAAVVPNVRVYAVGALAELVGFLNGKLELEPTPHDEASIDALTAADHKDFAEVRGQELGKRALTIAAAGRHNVLTLCTV